MTTVETLAQAPATQALTLEEYDFDRQARLGKDGKFDVFAQTMTGSVDTFDHRGMLNDKRADYDD